MKSISVGKRLSVVFILLLCTAIMPITASAAYYNTYTAVAALGNANGSITDQGFTAGVTYVYSVKIKDETKAVIYRTTMSDGTTTLMTNGDDGTTYATYLAHANDLVLQHIDGSNYMFVITMQKGSMSLVKLKYVGTTYYKVGNYDIQYNGADKSMSGITITGIDASNVYFLFKSNKYLYRGSIPLTANSGTISVTDAFTLDIVNAKVNGATISNITSYAFQGFDYYDDTIYVPMTYQNISIVLVYRNVSTASGTITADDNLSFRITSSAYPYTFEIESVGIDHTNGLLWFSCNRAINSSDYSSDTVAYFNGFSAF